MRCCAMSKVCGLAATTTLVLLLSGAQAVAHHSVLHYDGKTEVVISGVVTAAKFAFPHSVYAIDVENAAGKVERWTLTTEDPRDAARLGFADELKALKAGDRLKIVGWPHRFNEREIRGHQLHYPDGRVVFMRRGNYIWPEEIKRLRRFYQSPETLEGVLQNIEPGASMATTVLQWIEEGDPVARIAYEAVQKRAKLIGVVTEGQTVVSGVHELLRCHVERDDFVAVIDPGELDPDGRTRLESGAVYIAEYNRLLARWWEQDVASCE